MRRNYLLLALAAVADYVGTSKEKAEYKFARRTKGGTWNEVLNSDDKKYGGSGVTNGALIAQKKPSHGRDHSISFQLPPLCILIFEGEDLPKGKEQKASKAKGEGKKAGKAKSK